MVVHANGDHPAAASGSPASSLLAAYLASALRFASLAIASRSLFRAGLRFLPDLPEVGLNISGASAAIEVADASPDLIVAAVLHVFSSCLSLASEGPAAPLPPGAGAKERLVAAGVEQVTRLVPLSPRGGGARKASPGTPDFSSDAESERGDATREMVRTCGLHYPCVGPRRKSGVEEFAPRLQKLIANCRRVRDEGARFRIFDDCTVDHTSPGGVYMELTETRCTPFRRLRECSGLTEDQYYNSMCAKPFSGGTVEVSGKSGSIFLRTHDNQLVLKTIEAHEFEVLKQILPHMLLYLEHHPHSLLCRFLGAYALTVGRTTLRFVVMANVLPRKAEQVYDLKGTTEDRYVNPAVGGVLKDLNFAQYTMQFSPDVRSQLMEALCDDADFLESLGTMDYSLLVGVTRALGPAPADEWHLSQARRGFLVTDKGEQVEVDFQMGVIDFLQRWTPKKVAAHWFKKATIGCFHEIDTEPPTVYCQRFSKFFVKKIVVAGGAAQPGL